MSKRISSRSIIGVVTIATIMLAMPLTIDPRSGSITVKAAFAHDAVDHDLFDDGD